MNKHAKSSGSLLGDFVLDHLFWDENNKTMTLIDPGNNYMVEGNLAEDAARFIFSILVLHRWRFIRSSKLIILLLGLSLMLDLLIRN